MGAVTVRAHETEIAGRHWIINTLAASHGLKVLTWIGSIIGEGVGHVAGGVGAVPTPKVDGDAEPESAPSSLLDIEIGPDALAKAIGAVLQRLSDERTVPMIKTLLATLHSGPVGGAAKRIDFDVDFAGDYATLFLVVKWALGVNFSSFFVENPALQSIAKQAAGLSKKKQKATSTGVSGES